MYIFQPRTTSYSENQNDSCVQILSVRRHKTSTGEGNVQCENSSPSRPQVGESSNDLDIESSRIDVIRIIGPTGEEEDSFRIMSVGEMEDDAGCAQGQNKEEALKQSSTNRYQAEGGSTDDDDDDDDNDDDHDDHDDDDNFDDDNDDGAVDVVKVELQIRNNEHKDERLTDKNLVNLDEDELYQGRAVNNKTVIYSEKLAALVTKLAIVEVGQYCKGNKKDKICRNELKRHENSWQIKHYERMFNSNSKIHDCVNDIIRKAIEMSSKELAERARRREAFLKSKAFMEEKKHRKDVEKIEKFSLGTSEIYNPDGTKLANVRESNLFKDPDIFTTQHSKKMNTVEPFLPNRPLKGATVDVPSRESVACPIAYNAKEKIAENVTDYILNEGTQPNSAENEMMRATESFAQVLVANTIKQAISGVCNTNICLLYKSERSKK